MTNRTPAYDSSMFRETPFTEPVHDANLDDDPVETQYLRLQPIAHKTPSWIPDGSLE